MKKIIIALVLMVVSFAAYADSVAIGDKVFEIKTLGVTQEAVMVQVFGSLLYVANIPMQTLMAVDQDTNKNMYFKVKVMKWLDLKHLWALTTMGTYIFSFDDEVK